MQSQKNRASLNLGLIETAESQSEEPHLLVDGATTNDTSDGLISIEGKIQV